MHRQTARFEPLLFNNQHMNQSKTNVASINQKPIHIAPDPLLVGFSNPNTFNLRSIPPTLSFCAKPKAKSQNPCPTDNPRHPGKEGSLQKLVEGRWRALSPKLLISLTGTERQEEGFPSLFEMKILQLRASPTCRMTWEWGGWIEEETSLLNDTSTNGTIGTALVQC